MKAKPPKAEAPRKYPKIDERAAADFLSLQEIVATARRNLTQDLWNHLSGGSDSETTLLRNRQALDSLALRQRVLVDVRKIDITTTLLGKKLTSPVFLVAGRDEGHTKGHNYSLSFKINGLRAKFTVAGSTDFDSAYGPEHAPTNRGARAFTA